jgi:hypothetical protein
LEHFQFDDYRIEDDDDYVSDMPTQNMDAKMSFDSHELPKHALNAIDTVKIEDEGDVRNERCRLRNAKCAKHRRCTLEQHQPDNLYDFSMTNLRNVINVGRDTRNVIIAKQQERVEVEAYSPTNYHIPQDHLSSTRKRKSDSSGAPGARMEQPARGKIIISSKECFEKVLQSYCPWHPSPMHSAFE